MSFQRFLDFFGLGDSNNFPQPQQKKEERQDQARYPKQQQNIGQSRQRYLKSQQMSYEKQQVNSLKKRDVPQQLQQAVKQLRKQWNWYIFPVTLYQQHDKKEDHQKYKKTLNSLTYCQSVQTRFIFITHYEKFLSKSSHIHFGQLTNLILIQCDIDNIEALEWVDAPCLRNIYLDENCITDVKPLSKTTFRLSVLSFTRNPIVDFNLSRFQMKGNVIGPSFCLFCSNLFRIESPFTKLMKIQTTHLRLIDKNKYQEEEYYKTSEILDKLRQKVHKLQFNPQGIRIFEDFIQSKFQYLYMQKVQRRKSNIFVIQQP